MITWGATSRLTKIVPIIVFALYRIAFKCKDVLGMTPPYFFHHGLGYMAEYNQPVFTVLDQCVWYDERCAVLDK
jgi:hypothetical protein